MYNVPDSETGFFYKFPEIRKLNDILWAIKDADEILHIQKDGYSIIDYVVQTPDTFLQVTTDNWLEASLRMECRGLIFSDDLDCELVSRPFHKFFNIGEKDWTQPNFLREHELAYVANKEDGSMIRPVMINEYMPWRFMTRKGHTDVAKEAEDVYDKFDRQKQVDYDELFIQCWLDGKTPILEYVGPQNKIVLDYKAADIILIAVRDNLTGAYMPPQEIMAMLTGLECFEVSVVEWWVNHGTGNILDEHLDIKHLTDIEGRVMTFHNKYGCQTKVKLKTEWYVALHRAKSELEQPRNLIQMSMNATLDDLYPELDAETLDKVKDAEVHFWEGFHQAAIDIDEMLREIENRGMSRKEVALSNFFDDNVLFRSLVFNCWGKRSHSEVRDALRDYIVKNYLTNKSFEKVVKLLSLDKQKLNIR